MKKLSELVECSYDVLIKNIKTDSRQVEPGDLFVCIHGLYFDRHDFIDQAIEKGAVAIIVDKKTSCKVPVVMVNNTNVTLLEICEKFYDDPSSKLTMIATTGTDGKTTVAMMIWQLLSENHSVAYLGTNGLHFQKEESITSNTTPIPEQLYAYLDRVVKKNGSVVSMEVSSESLVHQRVNRIKFDMAILTNITEDHLNVHKTIEEYIKAKGKLFTLVKEKGICLLNHDDSHYEEMLPYCQNKQVYTYGKHPESDFQISQITYGKKAKFCITYRNETVEVESPYFGTYNVWNLTAAFAVCYLLGEDSNELLVRIKKMKPIPGRGEWLDYGQDYKVLLDYAHTENAIFNVLKMIKQYSHRRVITVMGSAGGREKEKRKGMGNIALTLSDLVIFTMDDPRNESVDEIIDDLVSGSDKKNYRRIFDRKQAIDYALSIAQKDDVVAILGKGRDHYMAVGDQYLSYCDGDVIKEYYQKHKDR